MSSTMAFEAVNAVKVNKLKEGYSWNVQVNADSSSLEDLREAKEKALTIAAELEDALQRPAVEEAKDEIPF